ncbi:lysophospholipid acyltransferase family protein [SAR86 cluster bacterium]|nr:lysophospholipid acyltransferase family protein [SAR86 cluster bacterium]
MKDMDYIDSKYFSYADPDDPILKKILIRSIEYLTGQPKLFKLYRSYQEKPERWKSFWDGCVNLLKLRINISNDDLDKIPETGPAIVVANHPFGVLDGLVLSWIVSQKRKDFKLLVHSLLLRAPETKGNLLPIDFTGDKQALLTNLDTRKKARKHISDGGCIIIFPSGTVSTTLKFYQKKTKAFDCEWKKFTSRLIKQTDPNIIPINFPGTNSLAFQIFSHISLVLRSSLLFFEIKRRINSDVEVFVGESFKYSELEDNLSNDELADLLRTKTYLLDQDYSSPPPYGLDPD